MPPDGKPNHYRAPIDTLVDSPIMAGNLAVNEFTVDGSRHFVVAGGNTAQWDGNALPLIWRKSFRKTVGGGAFCRSSGTSSYFRSRVEAAVWNMPTRRDDERRRVHTRAGAQYSISSLCQP